MLHPYKAKDTAALDFDYDPGGYWDPVRISNMALAYNPEKVSKNSIPNSLCDFAFHINRREQDVCYCDRQGDKNL
jgi:iron(III) transport system substrate-binding protein